MPNATAAARMGQVGRWVLHALARDREALIATAPTGPADLSIVRLLTRSY